MPNSQTKIPSGTSSRLTDMIRATTKAVEANRDTINALNVFPVPDGDTGTNMLLTLRSIIDSLPSNSSESANHVSKIIARSALLGARGNSGLILAQYFKGLAEAIGEDTELTGEHFARSIRIASNSAYKALPNPVEGTMLTVYRECADVAERSAAKNEELESVMADVAREAINSVRRTPKLLPVLAEAEVVDSGGFGFAVMLDGALRALRGEEPVGRAIDVPMPNGETFSGSVKAEFIDGSEEIEWGYCTVFAIQADNLDIDVIRDHMAKIGRSPIVDGVGGIAKVHVHMEDPGEAISAGILYGQLSNIEISNMGDQTSDWAAGRRSKTSGSDAKPKGNVKIAVVAVAVGKGLTDLIVSTGMGVTSVLDGGDTMNPSVADLLAAVESAPSNQVILLPNNKNVLPAALEVPGLTAKDVRVIHTRSVQSGVAALLEFSTALNIDENESAMNNVVGNVGDGRVCKASRDVTIHGRNIRKGMSFATFDDEIVAVGREPLFVLTKMIEEHAVDAEIITVYTGISLTPEQVATATEMIEAKFENIEIEVVYGGQPHYDYLVAVE
ncbi:MAG: DAK2 domain-containing protein [Chloroflexi bacterium]|nr:DAK2 domain-containing protein [Chloroflexota bacterium]